MYTDPSGEVIFTALTLIAAPFTGGASLALLPYAIAADIGGTINTVSNWKNIDNFGEGLAVYGLGAGTGVLTAVNPTLGATVGGALTSAGNDIIGQTGNGVGINDVKWEQVGASAVSGAVVGGVTYGVGLAINQTGITNKILDAFGITNNTTRNLVGSTVNGTISGTAGGFVNGVVTGLTTGDWDLWESTWKGGAYGLAGGLIFGSLTELGYQAQLKWGRRSGLNSAATNAIADGGKDAINQMKSVSGGLGGNGYTVKGTNLGEVRVVYNTRTGTTTVYWVVKGGYWQPPSPYQYNSPTMSNVVNWLRLRVVNKLRLHR